MRNISTSLVLLIFLLGCASTPVFETSQVDGTLTPDSVISEAEGSQGKQVLWGGVILNTQNLKDSTQIELLAYPLDRSQRPLRNKTPLGRFIIVHGGFLEPAVYAPGQLLTVLGNVSGSQQGNVGESRYTYPVLLTEKIQMWSPRNDSGQTRFHFGIGIGF